MTTEPAPQCPETHECKSNHAKTPSGRLYHPAHGSRRCILPDGHVGKHLWPKR